MRKAPLRIKPLGRQEIITVLDLLSPEVARLDKFAFYLLEMLRAELRHQEQQEALKR